MWYFKFFCAECGAVKAILTAQDGNASIEECRLIIKLDKGTEALDLRVWATYLDIENDRFVILTLKDIGDEKRREILERTFFHDILNDTGIITGYSENIKDGIMEMDETTNSRIYYIAKRMVETIQAQRDFAAC